MINLITSLCLAMALFMNGSLPVNYVTATNTMRKEGGVTLEPLTYNPTPEEIAEEELYGELELLAQLVQSEAGNQSLEGKRLVADVVLNRVDDPRFPDNITDVIFQERQFSPILDGGFDKAGWNMDEESYEAVYMEYFAENRVDEGILYFGTDQFNGKDFFKVGDHWFSY